MNLPRQLLEGYGRYRTKGFVRHKETHEYLALYGQQPEVMVISCCDSRVTPEGIFNVGPGELFVVRNVANLVPPYESSEGQHGTSAALEFAVKALNVKHVIVLGHGQCGGIKSFRENANSPMQTGEFIGRWIKLLEPAAISMACVPLDRGEDPQLAMEYAGIRQSLKNLRTFPFVEERIVEDKLALHGAWFDIGSGELRVMSNETEKFDVVNTDTGSPMP